jgi:hypothetical protein
MTIAVYIQDPPRASARDNSQASPPAACTSTRGTNTARVRVRRSADSSRARDAFGGAPNTYRALPAAKSRQGAVSALAALTGAACQIMNPSPAGAGVCSERRRWWLRL